MLDRDLAKQYEVETKTFMQSVKRNIDRFPDNFMFQLTQEEFIEWRSQFVTSKNDRMIFIDCHMYLLNKVLQCYLKFFTQKTIIQDIKEILNENVV